MKNNRLLFDLKIKETWYNIQSMYSDTAKKHNISGVMAFILMNIEKEGTSATEIASSIGLVSHSLTRHLKKLQDDKLAIKEVDSIDKRIMRYYLTEKGLEARKIASKFIQSYNDILENSLSKSEKESFYNIMDKVNNAVDIVRHQSFNTGFEK
nr:winged helix-turn-helix domain-containing protein [uncultured Psychroserpens sp.]